MERETQWAKRVISKKLGVKCDWHAIVATVVNLKNDADYMQNNLRKLD